MDHNHDNNERRTEMQQLSVSVKRKAGDDLTSRPSKLIRSELHKLDGHLLHSEDIRSVAQSLYKAWRNIPGLPKSRKDVHNAIELMDTRTSKDEEFVITNDVPSGLIIFSCSSNLEFLTNSAEEIFVDGTFRFCPKFVYQLYTIHGFRNGHFVPLVFALLSGKSDTVYRNMWNSLKAACTERNFNLQPKLIHVDFELTIHTVLNEVFPVANLKCCRFHLGQAWYRKMQNLGLSQD
jgi:hypothetical protein